MAVDEKSKSIDCYFYYYSECVRGNFCRFRHEPSALGCEEICVKWKEGTCTEPHCNLRHMELKKKRKEIPCYWERQPSGCRKAHCAFKHQLKGPQGQGDSPTSPEGARKGDSETTSQEWRNAKSEATSSHETAADSAGAEATRRLSQVGPESYSSSAAVEPIVVNFEEESDSESAPSWTPTKMPKEKESLHVKTLEEIRLEKIQAESAAFWEGIAGGPMAWEAANPAANPSVSTCGTIPASRKHCNLTTTTFKKSNVHVKQVTKELDFKVLSLDEIRKNRARKTEMSNSLSQESHNQNSCIKIQTNDHFDNQSCGVQSDLEITDLRVKLRSNTKTYNGSQIMNLRDSLSSKRQRHETSQSGPSKKQRLKLRRVSDFTCEEIAEGDDYEANMCEDTYIIGNVIDDIDKVLME